MLPDMATLPGPDATGAHTKPHAEIRRAAVALEAHFLAEILKSAGLHDSAQEFGGGAGEGQFGSFLRRAQAKAIAEGGGIGLAEAFFHAMTAHAKT